MRLDDPQATTALRQLLLKLVEGIPISTQLPREVTVPRIRIERVGGKDENRVTASPRFAIQIYAADGPAAEGITGQLALALLEGEWPGTRTAAGHRLRGWEEESVMSFPDPDRTDLARWQILGRLRISKLRPA